jgi:aryl-alcohol dehydrogenase-like predicted oxidoreductase
MLDKSWQELQNDSSMQKRTLGTSGPSVSQLGLGCMGISEFYGPADDAEGLATIHAALEAGVTLLDTGDFYGSGHNELLIGTALRDHLRDDVVVSVKFGALRDPLGGFAGYDGRPVAVKNFLAQSLKRLRTEYVDIYRIARTDPQVPIEETIGTIAELVSAGFVRHIGLSEACADDVRRAAAVHPISDLQIEYSLLSRGIESEILPLCRSLGIGITAYGVLSMGLLSSNWPTTNPPVGVDDLRAISPRFQGENFDHNQMLVQRLREIGGETGMTVAQLAIGWVVAQGADIVPLIGARRPDRLVEALASSEHRLGPEELKRIADAVPAGSAAGDLYPSAPED